jgi:hypothetical protein
MQLGMCLGFRVFGFDGLICVLVHGWSCSSMNFANHVCLLVDYVSHFDMI